ncbi:MAG: hypothetical protein J3K34DRAFT_169864 [Monoraphidium minutum]|nr:MAG: hypothetical protein J3K34DRAFT_169864 [Monoraphidium minutum]
MFHQADLGFSGHMPGMAGFAVGGAGAKTALSGASQSAPLLAGGAAAASSAQSLRSDFTAIYDSGMSSSTALFDSSAPLGGGPAAPRSMEGLMVLMDMPHGGCDSPPTVGVASGTLYDSTPARTPPRPPLAPPVSASVSAPLPASPALGPRPPAAAAPRLCAYRRMWAAVCAPRHKAHGGGGAGREVSVEDLIRVVQALPPAAPAADAVRPGLLFLDSRAFAALLKGLAKGGLAHRAAELFDEIRSLPPGHELAHLADVYTYTTAISQCSSHHQLRRALELVEEMRARSVALNVHTYSALLNVCLKSNELDTALDTYQQMLSQGVSPNLVTYNTLLDVYAKTGHYAEALGVLDQLDLQGIAAEPRTYHTVVAACNMCGRHQEALSVYERMLAKGLEPMPATYNAAVVALARLGHLPAALGLLGAAAAKGVDRNVATYAALLNACEAPGSWELAMDLLQRLQDDGLKPTTACFNSAINACLNGGQPAYGELLFERLYTVCKPDAATFNALVGVYCRASPQGAWAALRWLCSARCARRPACWR